MKASGTSLTERKEKRSKRREQEHQNEDGSTGNGENGGGNGNGNHNEDDFGDDDDAEWTTDVSKEAVKKRMKVSDCITLESCYQYSMDNKTQAWFTSVLITRHWECTNNETPLALKTDHLVIGMYR